MVNKLTETPQSSWVKAWAYVPSALLLVVVTNSGHTYAYDDVPQSLANRMATASSVGSFVTAELKDGGYNVTELDDIELEELLTAIPAQVPPGTMSPKNKSGRREESSLLRADWPFLAAMF